MARVCMGGTFDALHRGHRALLAAAFEAGDEAVEIGLTTDAFANAARQRAVRPYAERAADLMTFVASRGWHERARIRPIDQPLGFALEPRFTHVAVTPETADNGARINAARAAAGLPLLAVVVAPYVLADDGRAIKATRIVRGEIDAEGRLLRPARVAMGSDNPVKVEAARRAFATLWGTAHVRGFRVESGVPEQPQGKETWAGAENRARAALARWPEADFGVGLEAGLFELPGVEGLFDVQACVVVDAGGRVTRGQGPAFAHAPEVAEATRRGESVGDAFARLSGVSDIGRREGAVGWLSRGRLDRATLSEPAVVMALLPRARPDLYGL